MVLTSFFFVAINHLSLFILCIFQSLVAPFWRDQCNEKSYFTCFFELMRSKKQDVIFYVLNKSCYKKAFYWESVEKMEVCGVYSTHNN